MRYAYYPGCSAESTARDMNQSTLAVVKALGIDVAAVIDALRRLALERGASKQKGNVPLFNRAFLKTVETFGRSYEIGMIAAYKLGTGKLMNDTEKFPAMLKKGKIALLPPRGGDRKTVKRIFKTIKHSNGAKA